MKLKTLILFFISMFSFINITFAECSYNENVNLSSYAGNVKVGYDYTQIFDVVTYKIDVLNLIPELKVEVTNNYDKNFLYFNDIGGNTSYEYNISDLTVTHTFKIFANTYNCNNILLRTINIQTPKFNRYSLRPECKENPDFDLCQKFNPKKIDDEIFSNKLNEKIVAEEIVIEPDHEVIKKEFNIIVFAKENIILVGIPVIAIILLIILFKYRKNKKIGF